MSDILEPEQHKETDRPFCGTCEHRIGHACTRYPPTVFMFFQPAKVMGSDPQPMFATQYPIVQEGQTCGEHSDYID